ncbi:MAG: ribosomal protein S18-alanine N-acetyltransferase [Acidimicrobiales bacterium]
MSDPEFRIGASRQDVFEALRMVPMRRKHLRDVARIEQQCYPRPWSATLFLSELAQRTSRRYTVASLGPIVVGYCGLMRVEDEGHITTLTVDPAWHRRGIGALLLLDHAHASRQAGITAMTLEVRAGNDAAQQLYARFGFVPVGVRRNYYAETGEDALIMWAYDTDTPEYGLRLTDIEAQLRSAST